MNYNRGIRRVKNVDPLDFATHIMSVRYKEILKEEKEHTKLDSLNFDPDKPLKIYKEEKKETKTEEENFKKIGFEELVEDYHFNGIYQILTRRETSVEAILGNNQGALVFLASLLSKFDREAVRDLVNLLVNHEIALVCSALEDCTEHKNFRTVSYKLRIAEDPTDPDSYVIRFKFYWKDLVDHIDETCLEACMKTPKGTLTYGNLMENITQVVEKVGIEVVEDGLFKLLKLLAVEKMDSNNESFYMFDAMNNKNVYTQMLIVFTICAFVDLFTMMSIAYIFERIDPELGDVYIRDKNKKLGEINLISKEFFRTENKEFIEDTTEPDASYSYPAGSKFPELFNDIMNRIFKDADSVIDSYNEDKKNNEN